MHSLLAHLGLENEPERLAPARVRGLASLTHDSPALEVAALTNSSAIYVQAATLSNGGAGVVFGDGLECANSPFWRHGTWTHTAGASAIPHGAEPPICVRGHVTMPGVRHCQTRYRTPASF